MLGATTSNTGTSADNPPSLPSTNYSCTSCYISFQNGQEQRIHMKAPWHVYNLKRRIESLPPIPLDEFEAQNEEKVETGKVSTIGKVSAGKKPINSGRGSNDSSDEEIEDDYEDEENASPFQCLFCNKDFANQDVDFKSEDASFEANLEHMRIVHGMSIPDQEMIVDIESLVGYLATEVRVWHECIYCGATKPSTLSVQNHMRDKGHCLLNLEREPELLEFWESPEWLHEGEDEEQERPNDLSATEIQFASGKVIGSRHFAPPTKKPSRRRGPAVSTIKSSPQPPSGSEEGGSSSQAVGQQLPDPGLPKPRLSSSRQLSRRDEMSITGLSVQQRQALVLAEKKAQRSEAVARRAREWVYARGANSQKFDQLDNQMKMGKQNHSLLPR